MRRETEKTKPLESDHVTFGSTGAVLVFMAPGAV